MRSAVLPFGIVAYSLARSGAGRPSPLALAAALALLAASCAIGFRIWSREQPPIEIGIELALEGALAALLWLAWPPSQAWILLVWVGATAANVLEIRLALPFLVFGYALFAAGSVPSTNRPFVGGTANLLWGFVLFTSVFALGYQRRKLRMQLRQLKEALATLRAYSSELEEAQQELRAEALQGAALAATEERNRIAREIHDVLAHSLTVIIMQAQALKRLVQTDPPAAAEMADTLTGLARDGLDEARRSVNALHAGPAGVDGLAALRDMAHRFGQQTGMEVELRTEGEGPLSANAWVTLYRVAQEGLTNARRHGNAHHVRLCLRFGPPAVLQIDDDGRATQGQPVKAGNGLTGMSERASRLGGSVHYAARPEGGFHVEVELPE
ncbi:MAG: sensor histidine kinase [Chloroflexota bacterium]